MRGLLGNTVFVFICDRETVTLDEKNRRRRRTRKKDKEEDEKDNNDENGSRALIGRKGVRKGRRKERGRYKAQEPTVPVAPPARDVII